MHKESSNRIDYRVVASKGNMSSDGGCSNCNGYKFKIYQRQSYTNAEIRNVARGIAVGMTSDNIVRGKHLPDDDEKWDLIDADDCSGFHIRQKGRTTDTYLHVTNDTDGGTHSGKAPGYRVKVKQFNQPSDAQIFQFVEA